MLGRVALGRQRAKVSSPLAFNFLVFPFGRVANFVAASAWVYWINIVSIEISSRGEIEFLE